MTKVMFGCMEGRALGSLDAAFSAFLLGWDTSLSVRQEYCQSKLSLDPLGSGGGGHTTCWGDQP